MAGVGGTGTRFITSLIPGMVLFAGLVLVISVSARQMPGAWGVAFAIGGAVLVGLGVLLARAVLRDWRSLRGIRTHGYRSGMKIEDGQELAVEGRIECGERLLAPISGAACAAWKFRISEQRMQSGADRTGSRRVFIAAGVRAAPFELVADGRTFPVRAFPWVDESIRIAGAGRDHRDKVAELLQRLMDLEGGSFEGVEERRLALQDGFPGAVDQVARRYESPPDPDALGVQEEHVPLDRTVCLLGHFTVVGGALVPGSGLLGRALHLYSGSRGEVIDRLSGEVRGFGRGAVVMLGLGAILLALPFVLSG